MNIHEALTYVASPQPFDEDRYLEAGLVLVRNRARLTHRVFYTIPDPNGVMTANTDPKWDEVRSGSTGERCACGNSRTIWPLHWPPFEEGRELVLVRGQVVHVVPQGGSYRDTMIRLEIIEAESAPALSIQDDPFSDALNFAQLLSVRGFKLQTLMEALAKQTKPAAIVRGFPQGAGVDTSNMTVVTVKRVTLTEVVIGIGKGYVVSESPEKEFPLPHAH